MDVVFGEFLFNFIGKGFLECCNFHGFFLPTGEVKSQTLIYENFFIAWLQAEGLVKYFESFGKILLGHKSRTFADKGIEVSGW